MHPTLAHAAALLSLSLALAPALAAPDLADRKASEAHLGQLARRLQAAEQQVDAGQPETVQALRQALDDAPAAAALAEAFATRYPDAPPGLPQALRQAEQRLIAAGKDAAAKASQQAELQAQQARNLSGPAQGILFKQVADTCRAALDLAPGQPTCTALSAEADAYARQAAKKQAQALAKAKPPAERLKGAAHAPLRQAIASAYTAAWRTEPRQVILDGPAKAWTDRIARLDFEDLPVWILAPQADHCRAFHMTFRRHRRAGAAWGPWRSYSAGHTYALRCPKG